PGSRGQSVGRKMAEAMLDYFRTQGAHSVRTLVDEDRAELAGFFSSLGFEPAAVCPYLIGMTAMSMKTTTLPKPYHAAVRAWQEEYLPDYDFLLDNWEKHFPTDSKFELCAYRQMGMCTEIECGDMKGKPKFTHAADMLPEQAHHLFGAIRAQASTEFGSIQQHRLTLARAQEEEEQFWILRMMAEELRHGYQMLHLLVEDDWSIVSKESHTDLVEGILSMNTG